MGGGGGGALIIDVSIPPVGFHRPYILKGLKKILSRLAGFRKVLRDFKGPGRFSKIAKYLKEFRRLVRVL